MSRRLKRLITGVNDVCFLSYLATFLLFLSPLSYLVAAAKGQTATQILHSSSYFARTPLQHLTGQMITAFPTWGYAVLMTAGIVMVTIGSLLLLKAAMTILESLLANRYLSSENVVALRRAVLSQVWSLVGVICLASANQLTLSWLGRENTGVFGVTWSAVFNCLMLLAVVVIAYGVYRQIVVTRGTL